LTIVGKLVKTLFKNVKHHTHKKKARMITAIFTEFLRGVGNSINVGGRNILLFWITVPLIHKIHHCVLYTDLHKNILYLDWTGLDAEKDVNTSSFAAADNEIATHGVSSMESCVMVVGMTVAVRRERGINVNLNQE